MQKVQTVNLAFVEDRQLMIESYETLGFVARVEGDDLHLYWGKPPKKKKVEEVKEEKPERRTKTERRLGRKFGS